jgi:hypothetical protein
MAYQNPNLPEQKKSQKILSRIKKIAPPSDSAGEHPHGWLCEKDRTG